MATNPIIRCIKGLFVFLLIAITINDARAAQGHAILVGVSTYDNLPPYQHLRGPVNDVRLINDVLGQRGFTQDKITILADQVAEATRPTRANIIGALEALTPELDSGDFVFLYFAGHGSQQPARNSRESRETDGLDEIFLPADIGKWTPDVAEVENAITDDEIGQHITSMRNRGAFVWAVFDTCHSGTMTRAAPVAGERLRNVDPVSDLGIPKNQMAKLSNQADSSPLHEAIQAGAGIGGLVAFYASQSLERTPEMRLPAGAENGRPHGLFTYNLSEVLTRHKDISYRQAGQLVLQNYTVQNRHRPTPLFEGSNLDAPVFATAPGRRVEQWPLLRNGSRLEISGGSLHLLETGSILSVVPNAASTDRDVIGYVEITDTNLARSKVKSVAYAGYKSVKSEEIPGTAFTRLVEPRFNFKLRVAAPALTKDDMAIAEILAELIGDKRLNTRLEVVEPGQDADVHLLVNEDQLLLLPASVQDISQWQGPTIDLEQSAPELRTDLVVSLSRIAKVLNLLRLSQHMPATQLAVRLEASLQRSGSEEFLPFPIQSVPRLRNGDVLDFRIENQGYKPADVTLLLVDSAYQLSQIYPREIGELNRIEPRGSDSVRGIVDTLQSSGRESLLMLAVAAETNVAPADFSFLTQDTPFLDDNDRGGATTLSSVLRDAGFMTGGSRGPMRSKSTDLKNASITIISWLTETDSTE